MPQSSFMHTYIHTHIDLYMPACFSTYMNERKKKIQMNVKKVFELHQDVKLFKRSSHTYKCADLDGIKEC